MEKPKLLLYLFSPDYSGLKRRYKRKYNIVFSFKKKEHKQFCHVLTNKCEGF